MTIVRSVKHITQGLFYFILNNLLLIALVAFFAYRTFFLERLNWALLVLLIALFLIVVCRAIAHYRQSATATFIYRALVVLSVALVITAIFIQVNRFIYVFVPTLAAEPTLSRILVRIGITTAVLYVFAVIIAGIYYLYAHDMTKIIWNGSINRLLDTTFSRKGRQSWQQVRLSNAILLHTALWGGLASILTLAIGLVGWLLR